MANAHQLDSETVASLRKTLEEAANELPNPSDTSIKARMAECILKAAASGVTCPMMLKRAALEEATSQSAAA